MSDLIEKIDIAKDEAAEVCFNALASCLGNPEYFCDDGSDSWDGDVSGTISNILVAAGVVEDDTMTFATHQTIATLTAELQEMRLELIASHGQTQTALEGKAALTAENERLTAEVAELKDQIDTIYQDMAEG